MDIRVPFATVVQHYAESDETLWARLVSFVLSPPIVWAVGVFPIAVNVSDTARHGVVYASIFTAIVCVMPMAFVAYMVKIGKIGDLHMRESHERYIPYSLSIIGAMITGLMFIQLRAPAVLLILIVVTVVQLFFMLVGTFIDHISFHAMAITSVTSAVAIIFSVSLSMYFVPVILLVVLARLVLLRHTPLQLVAGSLIGILTPFLVIFLMNLVF